MWDLLNRFLSSESFNRVWYFLGSQKNLNLTQDIVLRLLDLHPDSRITVEDALQHKFFEESMQDNTGASQRENAPLVLSMCDIKRCMKQPNSGKADPNEADNEFQAILYETNHKIVSYLRQVAKEGGGLGVREK